MKNMNLHITESITFGISMLRVIDAAEGYVKEVAQIAVEEGTKAPRSLRGAPGCVSARRV